MQNLSKGPFSLKLLTTLAVCGMAITYSVLALHIFIDTSFQVSTIKEAYSTMEWMELVDHTHKYLPYYGIYIFAFSLFLFVLGTSYSEKLKRWVVILPNLFILLDIASMWGIRYLNADIFSWGLFLAGILLALSFFTIALLLLYDIWLRKTTYRSLY